jgi:hypothetical protein
MQLIDEQIYEDHFIEVTLKEREVEELWETGEFKSKVLCNNEIISFAIILEHDKTLEVEQNDRQIKKSRHR